MANAFRTHTTLGIHACSGLPYFKGSPLGILLWSPKTLSPAMTSEKLRRTVQNVFQNFGLLEYILV